MKKIIGILVTIALSVSVYGQGVDYACFYKDLPFEMPVLKKPAFKDIRINIADCGGVGDGVTLNTSAFEKAM
jgi:hypothetical protein